tara:strand:- start:3144 stop:4007 length:864 start_codon:yes stop_codon:yes gene_type:complete
MKGIILAGGSGSRLFPLTSSVSKQLLPIYDKPMIFYSLSVLMLAGIKDIMIISTPDDLPLYQKLLKEGKHLGVNICYAIQNHPNGIAEAFIIGEKFIGNDPVCLILGDNIFYGDQFSQFLHKVRKNLNGATIFGYRVKNPKEFGIIELDEKNNPISIQEKPKKPKSNYAVTGLYFYDKNVISFAKTLKPSARGELEITEINNLYLKENKLTVRLLGRGFAWLDTGTHENLIEASQFIHTVEKRQGLKIACIEEISLLNNWISPKDLKELTKKMPNSSYKEYLINLIS